MRRSLKDAADVACLAGHILVLAEEFEARREMVEARRRPGLGRERGQEYNQANKQRRAAQRAQQ